MTLTEFLLARIAEDEQRLVHEFDCDRFNTYDYGTRSGDCDCDATARVLAECEAKRRIVELHTEGGYRFCPVCDDTRDDTRIPCQTVRHLAAVYADHPGYRAEWKP